MNKFFTLRKFWIRNDDTWLVSCEKHANGHYFRIFTTIMSIKYVLRCQMYGVTVFTIIKIMKGVTWFDNSEQYRLYFRNISNYYFWLLITRYKVVNDVSTLLFSFLGYPTPKFDVLGSCCFSLLDYLYLYDLLLKTLITCS